MQQIRCNSCKQVQRVEYDNVALVHEIPEFCAFCGSTDIEQVKVDAYWYDLAESLGFERSSRGADLIQGLYRLWDITKHRRFRDYIEELISSGEIQIGTSNA